MANLLDLSARDEAGNLRVIVETPKNSAVKMAYRPRLGVFELERLIESPYPYDWGFIPGTLAADGDPLDAMVIFEGHTWPGVVIPCVGVALLKVSEVKHGEREARRNDRLIATPIASLARGARPEVDGKTRAQLEQFFVETGQLAHKRVSVEGWGREQELADALAAAVQAYEAKRRPPR